MKGFHHHFQNLKKNNKHACDFCVKFHARSINFSETFQKYHCIQYQRFENIQKQLNRYVFNRSPRSKEGSIRSISYSRKIAWILFTLCLTMPYVNGSKKIKISSANNNLIRDTWNRYQDASFMLMFAWVLPIAIS